MTKEEIQKRIYSCQNDDDIKKFISERIKELETDEEKIVGQNYTDRFDDFISNNIHYKPADRLGDTECPDLVYDDMTPYISLIKSIRENSWYNELTLFTTIFFEIYGYLPNSGDIGLDRYFTYKSHEDSGRVSIKDIKNNECAFCSENSGLSHNMFKLLGIDSSVICGMRDNVPHAYNIIYPKGYGNNPAVMYDPSHHIDFIDKAGNKKSFGYYKVLSKEEYEKMLNGENVTLDISVSGEKLKQLYGYNGALDGFEMKQESPTYGIGTGKTKLQRKNTELSALETEAREYDELEALKGKLEQKEGQNIGE